MGVLDRFGKKKINESLMVPSAKELTDWVNTGITLSEEGDFEKAIGYYDKVLAIRSLWEVWNNKGNALRQLGIFNEARHCFEEALKINPEGIAAWAGKGNVLVDLNEEEEAIFCYNKALMLCPEDSRKAVILSEKGALLAIMGKEREADECFQMALALDSQNYLIRLNKALSYIHPINADKLTECIERAIEAVPEDERPQKFEEMQELVEKELGCRLKETEDVINKYKSKIREMDIKKEAAGEKENLSAEAWNFKGESLLKTGKFNDALKCFDETLNINPKLFDGLNNRGKALHEMGRFDEALKCQEMALELEPQNPAAWYNKGVTLASLKRHKESLECYEKVLETNPESASTWAAKGFSLGLLLKYNEALQCFNKALEIDPTVEHAQEIRERILMRVKSPEVEKMSNKAKGDNEIKERDLSAEEWFSKAESLVKTGILEESLNCYDKVLEINPHDADAWNNKGDTLAQLVKHDGTIELSSDRIG